MSAFLSFAFELWLSLVFLLVLVTFKIFFLSDEQYIVVCPVHWTLMCVQRCVSLLCVCLVVTYFFFQMFNETHRSDIRGATYLLLYHLRHLGQKRYLCHVCGAVSPPPFFFEYTRSFSLYGDRGWKKICILHVDRDRPAQTDRQAFWSRNDWDMYITANKNRFDATLATRSRTMACNTFIATARFLAARFAVHEERPISQVEPERQFAFK